MLNIQGFYKRGTFTTYANQNVTCIKCPDLFIESGEISLGDLASTESDCSSAKNKGDLGFFGPGQMQSKELLLCIIIMIILIINSS